MRRRPAKVLEPEDVRLVLEHVRHQRHPERNRVIVLASFKAGLRACEIAGLEWPMVLASDKRVGNQIIIAPSIAKKGAGRLIPLHAHLKAALQQLHKAQGRPLTGAVARSERGDHLTAGSVVNWFGQLYRKLELVGCSSHSGRRTFITASARLLAKTGGSLRDIQELAGHRALTTTERYIEGDRAAQRKLISLL
jgi:integrase/recombinase XerC